MNGILVVNKPSGFTSFDVVAKLRRILFMKKIGHGGTLDPLATGVLPIFLGRATKIISIIPNQDKRYVSGFKLGIKTNTQDITGDVVSQRISNITFDELLNISKKFIGDIYQIPPMYSAVKVNGQKLCNLARKGKEIKRSPRLVTVNNIKIVFFDENKQQGVLEADVSKGTYIRTLINDIGESLGVGATLTSLNRIKAMGFDISQSVTLDDIEKLKEIDRLDEILVSVEESLNDCLHIQLDDRLIYKVINGVKIKIDLLKNNYYRVYNNSHEFIGVGYNNEDGYFKFKDIT